MKEQHYEKFKEALRLSIEQYSTDTECERNEKMLLEFIQTIFTDEIKLNMYLAYLKEHQKNVSKKDYVEW